jgi:hypothetical protein
MSNIEDDKDFMLKFKKSYYNYDNYRLHKKYKTLLRKGKTKEEAYEELEKETIENEKEELDKIQKLQENDDKQKRSEFEATLAEDEAEIEEYNKSRNAIIDEIIEGIKGITELEGSLHGEFFEKLKYNKPTDEQMIRYLDDLEKKVYLNDSIMILKLITDIITIDTKIPGSQKEDKIKYYVDKISDEEKKINELRNLSNDYFRDKKKSNSKTQQIEKIIKTINAKRKREELRKAFVDEEFTKQKKTVISGRKNEARQNIIVPSEILSELSDKENILNREELNQLYNMYNPTKKPKVKKYMDKIGESTMTWVRNLTKKSDKTESYENDSTDPETIGFSGGNKKSKKRKNKRRKTTKRRKTKKAKK